MTSIYELAAYLSGSNVSGSGPQRSGSRCSDHTSACTATPGGNEYPPIIQGSITSRFTNLFKKNRVEIDMRLLKILIGNVNGNLLCRLQWHTYYDWGTMFDDTCLINLTLYPEYSVVIYVLLL